MTGHTTNGSTRNAEPYAMAALLNRMQKLASNKNWKLIEVARMIQSAEEVFQLLEHSH